MNIRVEILDVVMDQLASVADYTEIEGVLAPLYTDGRLKLLADKIFFCVSQRTYRRY